MIDALLLCLFFTSLVVNNQALIFCTQFAPWTFCCL